MKPGGLDITGQRFGRLVAIKKVGDSNSHGTLWLCKCDCGKEKEVRMNYLRTGGTTSCGCYRHEQKVKQMSKSAKWTTKHGQCRRKEKHHPLYGVWSSMRGRCTYPSHISYKNYGARGIKVCGEWEDFQTFFDWAISNGWEKGLAIDRIDPDGDYCPRTAVS